MFISVDLRNRRSIQNQNVHTEINNANSVEKALTSYLSWEPSTLTLVVSLGKSIKVIKDLVVAMAGRNSDQNP